MAYIGQEPVNTFSQVPTKDSFTGDGSTTTFDLSNAVVSSGENALEVFVNNVRQEPGSGKAFTLGVDGSNELKRITFSAAPASGASIYVINDKTSFTQGLSATDLGGVELILDADGDTSLTADTDDRIDIKIASTDHIQLGTSSGDTTIKIATDAKDLQFLQADGNKLLEINDGNFVGVGGNSTAAGEIRIFEDTDNGSNYVGLSVGNVSTSYKLVFPNADGSSGQAMVTNGSGVLTFTDVSSAADDITAGDAAINLTTTSGNITIDAQGNDTDIILKGTDGGSDTTFLTIDGSAAGEATFNAGIVIADAGNIGSASDKDAIAISSGGVVTMNQIPVFSAGINVSGGSIAGTLSTAAQANITSLGTLTALTVDDVAVNGKVITMTGSSSDTAVITAGTNGTLSIVTTDDSAAAANITITADGTFEADGTTITLDSTGDIVLDADGGDVIFKDDGTTFGSATNTSGNLIIKSGTTTAATFSGANVTFAGTIAGGGTLTTGGNVVIPDAGNIGSASDTDAIAISSGGVVTFSQAPVFPDGSIAVADLDIDGGTDIGANLADADLFIVDDGAGGTNRKMAASRIATYVGASAGAFSIANLDIDGGTDIGADLVDADLFIVDDGAGGTNRKVAASRIKTYIGGGTQWQSVKTSNYTASAGEGVFMNTTSGALTLTLPASPAIGDEVSFVDYAGTFDSNNLTIARNSSKIAGAESDLTVATERAANTLVFTDSTQGWLLKNK